MDRRQIVFQVADVLFTSVMIALDGMGVQELRAGQDGPTLGWQWFALLGFLVFVTMSWRQQSEMFQRLHPERLVKVFALGEPTTASAPRDWRAIDFDHDNERITHASASVRVTARNRGAERRVLSHLFLEVISRRWWWPFRRVVATIEPNIIDNHSGLVDSIQPQRVNWTTEPEGEELLHVVDFDRWWDRGEGPRLPQKWDMRLVADYGGADRRVHILIMPPPEKPLPRVKHVPSPRDESAVDRREHYEAVTATLRQFHSVFVRANQDYTRADLKLDHAIRAGLPGTTRDQYVHEREAAADEIVRNEVELEVFVESAPLLGRTQVDALRTAEVDTDDPVAFAHARQGWLTERIQQLAQEQRQG